MIKSRSSDTFVTNHRKWLEQMNCGCVREWENIDNITDGGGKLDSIVALFATPHFSGIWSPMQDAKSQQYWLTTRQEHSDKKLTNPEPFHYPVVVSTAIHRRLDHQNLAWALDIFVQAWVAAFCVDDFLCNLSADPLVETLSLVPSPYPSVVFTTIFWQ